MFEFTDYLDRYDLWNPLSVLTLIGVVLAVINVAITKKLGSGPFIFAYAAAYGILAIAMAWGYVILSEAGAAPRLGQVLVFAAIDLLLGARIALTYQMAGSFKILASEAPINQVKPIDAIIGEKKDVVVLRKLTDVQDTVHEISKTVSETHDTTNSKMDRLLTTVGESGYKEQIIDNRKENK